MVDPNAMYIPPEVLRLLPSTLVSRHRLVPIDLTESTLTIAMADPTNLVAIHEIKFLTGFDIKVVVASTGSIAAAIARYYTGH